VFPVQGRPLGAIIETVHPHCLHFESQLCNYIEEAKKKIKKVPRLQRTWRYRTLLSNRRYSALKDLELYGVDTYLSSLYVTVSLIMFTVCAVGSLVEGCG
jgi:hypothetical protein